MEIEFSKLLDPVIWYPILTYIGLCTADFVLGVVANRKDFQWDKVTKWLSEFGAEGIGLLALGVASAFNPAAWIGFGPALVAAIGIKTKDVIQKAMSLFKKTEIVVVEEPTVVETTIDDSEV
jgi:hypothetical protein